MCSWRLDARPRMGRSEDSVVLTVRSRTVEHPSGSNSHVNNGQRLLSAMVFEPTPVLTVTAEPGASDAATSKEADLHLHPGGQGLWIARMLKALGLDTQLCAPLGGETGAVLK